MRSPDSVRSPRTPAVRQLPVGVASVPWPYGYVGQLSTGGHRTQWLPGPAPRDGRKIPGGWWLTLMPGPAWIRDDQARFEVVHVHFVFDGLSSEQLGQVVDTLPIGGMPAVYTVHDLRSSHQPHRRAHDHHLDLWVAAADELITLKVGAGCEIKGRSQPKGVPRPQVAPPSYLLAERPPIQPGSPFVIGVHARSISPNMSIMPLLQALAGSMRRWPDAVFIDVDDVGHMANTAQAEHGRSPQ